MLLFQHAEVGSYALLLRFSYFELQARMPKRITPHIIRQGPRGLDLGIRPKTPEGHI